MDIDDFSESAANTIDSSSPGSVSQQIRRFNSYFNHNPAKFPSKPLTEKHFQWLKSSSVGSSTPVSGEVIEELLVAEDQRNNSKLAGYLSDQAEMAIGRISTTPPSTYIPGQHSGVLSEGSEAAKSDVLSSPAQGSVPASEIEILDEVPEETKEVTEEQVLPPPKPAETPSPAPQKKKPTSVSETKLERKAIKPVAKSPVVSSASKAASPSPSAKKITRATAGRARVTVPEPFSLATDRRASLPSRSAEQPSVTSSKPKAGVVRASFESPQIPPKPSPKPATSPEPFRLASVKRHEEAQERLKAEQRVKARQEEEKRKFRAQPILQPAQSPVIKGSPPTKSAAFKLSVDSRADKRKEFSKYLDDKAAQKLQEKKNVSEKNKAELEEQMKQFRNQLVFKASPMPSFYKKIKEGEAPANKSKSAPVSPLARRTPAAAFSTPKTSTLGVSRGGSLRKSVEVPSGAKPSRALSESFSDSEAKAVRGTSSSISGGGSRLTSSLSSKSTTRASLSAPRKTEVKVNKAETPQKTEPKRIVSRLSSRAPLTGPTASSASKSTVSAAAKKTPLVKPSSTVRQPSPVRSSSPTTGKISPLRSSSPGKATPPIVRSSSPRIIREPREIMEVPPLGSEIPPEIEEYKVVEA